MDEGTAAAAALVPIRQQQVVFYGDQLPAAQLADGTVLVPLKPICEALGLNWAAQRNRLTRDPVLAEALTVSVTDTVQGPRPMICLPLDLLPGFLFGINAARVKPELQAKILRYRKECFRVLWEAFKGDIGAPSSPEAGASGAELALQVARAVVHLAEQQVALERAQAHATLRLDSHDQRIGALEVRLDPKQVLTEEQAAELALAVKNVGQRLATTGDRAGYAKVYSELYRRYRVSSYKNLPQAQLAAVLAWLAGWYAELGGQGSDG